MEDSVAENQFQYILQSTNPDKDLEFFWVTFKCCLINNMSEEFVNEINKLSEELNIHQKNKEYDTIFAKINNFLDLYLTEIIKTFVIEGKIYNIKILYKNIMRWKKICSNFDTNTLDCNLLKVVRNLNLNSDNDIKILTYVQNYLYDKNDKHITDLFELAIEIKNICLIDVLKNKVNLEEYLETKINKNILNSMSANKLIRYLKDVA